MCHALREWGRGEEGRGARLSRDVSPHEWQCLCRSGLRRGRKVQTQGFGKLQLSLKLLLSLLQGGPRAELPLSTLNVLPSAWSCS